MRTDWSWDSVAQPQVSSAFSDAQCTQNVCTVQADVIPAGSLPAGISYSVRKRQLSRTTYTNKMAPGVHVKTYKSLFFKGQHLLQIHRCLNFVLSVQTQASLKTSVFCGRRWSLKQWWESMSTFTTSQARNTFVLICENLNLKNYILLCVEKAPQRFSVLY